MKWSEEAKGRVETYLREVERHMAHKPAEVRQEVLADLRDHIAEAMRRAAEQGGRELEAVERILAEMDPPETFAEAAVEMALGVAAAEAASTSGNVGAKHWFALGLAFLAVNGYGVWRWTDSLARREAVGVPVPKVEEALPAERILRLRKVEQVDVSPEREMMLRFVFSDRPDREQMTRFLRLSAPGQGEVDYHLAGTPEAHVLLVQTHPVLSEKLDVSELFLVIEVEREMRYVRAEVRHQGPLGAGLWQAGVQLTEIVSLGEYPELQPLKI